MMSQLELEARYAGVVSAKAACFVYADRVEEAVDELGLLGERDLLVDVLGGAGLRVADVRSRAAEIHAAGGMLLVDNTVPSSFGCEPFACGADLVFEALDRVAAGALERKVVAIASRAHGLPASHALAAQDVDAIARGLDSLNERIQRHFDNARALAAYLSCCEELDEVAYPGLAAHVDHELASRVLRHGFGPAVDFVVPAHWGATARDVVERCRRHGRDCPAGGCATRTHARDGWDARAIRIFAGLDNPLEIAADLDRAFRSFM